MKAIVSRWHRVPALAVLLLAAVSAVAQDRVTDSRYDERGLLIAKVFPATAGQATRMAERYGYTDGAPTRVEKGVLAGSPDDPQNWGQRFTVTETATTTHDARGNRIKLDMTTSGGFREVLQYSYDAFDRVVCEAQRMDPSRFDALPEDACALSNPDAAEPDRIVKKTYDTEGRVLTVTHAWGTSAQRTVLTHTYTAAGSVATVKDANGNLSTNEYDVFNRRVTWRFPDPVNAGVSSTVDKVAFTYDKSGQMLSRGTRDGSTINYDHDERGRETGRRFNGRGRDVNFELDNGGHIRRASFVEGGLSELSYEYDGFGNLRIETSTRGAAKHRTVFKYDSLGSMTEIVYPSGMVVRRDVDASGQLGGLHVGPMKLAEYGYDVRGRLTSAAIGGRALKQNFDYGADQRVSAMKIGTASAQTGVAVTFGFTRNQAGQIVTRGLSNEFYVYPGDGAETVSYTPNGLNQYAAISNSAVSWSGNGELATLGARSFKYDAEGKLTQTTGVGASTLTYDPMGRLESMQVVGRARVEFVHVAGEIGVELTNGAVTAQYIHGVHGQLLARASAANTVEALYVVDERGSPVLITDATGWPAGVASYSPYGKADVRGASPRFGFGGNLELSELGLIYNQARFYSAELGRFIQTDPAEYASDANLYAFAENDPLNNADPTGLATDGDCTAGSSRTCDESKASAEGAVPNTSAETATAGRLPRVYIGPNPKPISLPKPSAGTIVAMRTLGVGLSLALTPSDLGDGTITGWHLAQQVNYRKKALTAAGLTALQAKGLHVHHIAQKNHQDAQIAVDNLKQVGIDVNDLENLVILPASLHAGVHTANYRAAVNAATTAALPGGRPAMVATLNMIAVRLVMTGSFP